MHKIKFCSICLTIAKIIILKLLTKIKMFAFLRYLLNYNTIGLCKSIKLEKKVIYLTLLRPEISIFIGVEKYTAKFISPRIFVK